MLPVHVGLVTKLSSWQEKPVREHTVQSRRETDPLDAL